MIQIITKQKEGFIPQSRIEHFFNEYTTRASAFFFFKITQPEVPHRAP